MPGQPVEIGAIADTHPDARREFGEFFGVPSERRYTDYREMLDAERPDFVDVCSWHGLHAEMTIAAAARRPKAIICQKPMALSLADCDRMLTACQREGVKLLVAHQRRHLPGWQAARKLIAEGAIGRIEQIIVDSGALLNVASHDINLALYLLGDPQAEWALGAVERTTEPGRGRPSRLRVTDEGRSLLRAGSAVVADAEEDLLAGLDPDRRRRLTADLSVLFRNSLGGAPGSR